MRTWPALWIVAWLLACSEKPSVDSRPAIKLPPPPANLSQQEERVREQFRERYDLAVRLLDHERTSDSGLSWALGRLGQWFLAYRELPAAERCFTQAQVLDPGEYRWPYLLGHSKRFEGDLAASYAAFERALALRPGDIPILIGLGENAFSEQRFEDAESWFQQALENDPQSVMARLGLARLALERGLPQKAIDLLGPALEAQPNAQQLLYLLGTAWRRAGDLERGRTFFARIPSDEMAHVQVEHDDPLMQEVSDLRQSAQIDARNAARAISRGRFQVAIKELEQSLAADPERPDTRYNLAASLFQLGRRSEAWQQLEILIEQNPRHTLGRTLFALLLIQDKRFNQAREELTAALAIDPEAAHVHLALGDLERHVGDLARALQSYEQALHLAPDHPRGHFGRGLVLMIQNRYDEAIAAVEKSLSALPNQPGLAALLARLLAATPNPDLRDGQRALALAEKAVREQPTLTHIETLAMALAETKDFEKAASWQEKAWRSLPTSHSARARLKSRLELYRAERPCREPWLVDEHPMSARVNAEATEAR